MNSERKISNLEKNMLLLPIKAYINSKYNLVVEQNDTIGLKPPYLILGNHVTDWDPLFINANVEEPIRFVASASAFRKPIMQKILGYAGAIAKTKSRTDTSTIRNILKAKKANRIIGLFPEGNRNWNGLPEPIFYSTVKLMKSLNIPIVIVNIKGGYLSHPRWADIPKKGQISIALRKVWDIGDLKEMSHDEIFEQLQKELYVNDFKWAQENNVSFKGKRLAEGIERYLFMCPSCNSIHSLHSHDNKVSCNTCSYEVEYTEQGLFTASKQPLLFEYIYDWNNWQINQLRKYVADKELKSQLIQSLVDEVYATKSLKDGTYIDLGKQTLLVEDDSLVLVNENGDRIIMPITILDGTNIFKQHVINFFFEEQHYHLELINNRRSAHLWLQYILIIQLLADPNRDPEF